MQALQKILPAGTEVSKDLEIKIEAINANDFVTAHKMMPATIEKAVDVGFPMVVIGRACSGIVAQIEFELIQLLAKVNIDQRLTIQAHQVPAIAQDLFNDFKNESIEDIAVCLKRGAMAKYGEIYRLDLAVISGWMHKYLDEKYEVLVNNMNAQKESPYQVSRGAKVDIMLKLMKEALGDYKDPSEVNQQKLAEHRVKAREEMKKRNETQKLLNRAASEYYKTRPTIQVQKYEDDKGFYVFAANLEDAEKIYQALTQKENQVE